MASGLSRNVQVVARTLFASLDGLVLQYLAGVERDLIAASLDEVHDAAPSGRGGRANLGCAWAFPPRRECRADKAQSRFSCAPAPVAARAVSVFGRAGR